MTGRHFLNLNSNARKLKHSLKTRSSEVKQSYDQFCCMLRIYLYIISRIEHSVQFFWPCLMKFALLQHPNEMLAYGVLNPHERNIYILKYEFIVSRIRLVYIHHRFTQTAARRIPLNFNHSSQRYTRRYRPSLMSDNNQAIVPVLFPFFFLEK